MATADWIGSAHEDRAVPELVQPDRAHEIRVLALGALVYSVGRAVVEGSAVGATHNAQRLLDLERSIGIDIESAVQQVALDHSAIRWLGNFSYVWLHWPLLLAVLYILFRTDHRLYFQLRNAMFASGAVGLVLFATVPMSPPRFMAGFVGTVSDDARRLYIGYPLSWTNRFAAFPSFHVGWTLVACLALASAMNDRRISIVALAPGAMVAFAVISTGNHYVVDSVAGAAIAWAAYGFFGRYAPAGSAQAVGEQGGEVDARLAQSRAGRPFDDQIGDESPGRW